MSRLVAIWSLLAVAVILFGKTMIDSFVVFIIAGRIPIIGLTIPALAMLVFWIALIPATILISKISKASFWRLIGSLGELHQRQINRQIRWLVTISSLELLLSTVYLVLISDYLSQVSVHQQAISTPRRFMALPV